MVEMLAALWERPDMKAFSELDDVGPPVARTVPAVGPVSPATGLQYQPPRWADPGDLCESSFVVTRPEKL